MIIGNGKPLLSQVATGGVFTLAALLDTYGGMGDLKSLSSYGGVGDGVTDCSAAITAAEADGTAVFVPDGTWLASSKAPTQLNGRFWGPGQIKDSGGDKRGPIFTAIKSVPSIIGNSNSVTTAFNGDLSCVPFATEYRITGSATLGQPTSGYRYNNEASPFFTYFYNSSGWNQSTSGNDGRTAATAFRTMIAQVGQGDCVAYNASGFVSGSRAGATHFLASPAASLFNGGLIAASDGVYLNPGEFNLQGGVYDCAAIGWVVNLSRDNATGALDAYWAGFRVQSKGSAAADDAYVATGKYTIGLNLIPCDFGAGQAAIALKSNQRIYGNSTNSDSAFFRPATLGTEYFGYSTADTGWSFNVGGGSAVVLGNSQIKVGSNKVVAARKTGWTASTGTALRTGFDTTTATLTQVAQTLKALIDDLHSTAGHGLIGT